MKINSLADLITISALKAPLKIAVRDRDKEFTYAQLDHDSNAVAAYLIDSGFKAGEKAGIFLAKSYLGIAVLFGILKAGGVYVPLDLNWAPERINRIALDCRMDYLITQEVYSERLKGSYGVVKIIKKLVIAEEAIAFGKPLDKRKIKYLLSKTANIIYTSGSTGQPKGVEMSEKAVLADLKITRQVYNIIRNDKFALYFPFSFAPSFSDVMLMVFCGATISIMPEGLASFPLEIKKFLNKEKITFLRVDPKILIAFYAYAKLKKNELPYLKKIISNGSKIPARSIKGLKSKIPVARFYNEYAATETLLATVYPVPKNVPLNDVYLPIGKPVKPIKTFLADTSGKSLKMHPGIIGELYVSSPSLMKGYWNNKAETKKSIFHKIFSGKRYLVYRSHDLVKIDGKNGFLFIGRCDNIIKTHGYRVNLDEVEYILQGHPSVKEAVVLAVADQEFENRVFAWVVVKDGCLLDAGLIKDYCRKFLAHYMMPEEIFFINDFPRTSSGKVDKALLISLKK